MVCTDLGMVISSRERHFSKALSAIYLVFPKLTVFRLRQYEKAKLLIVVTWLGMVISENAHPKKAEDSIVKSPSGRFISFSEVQPEKAL